MQTFETTSRYIPCLHHDGAPVLPALLRASHCYWVMRVFSVLFFLWTPTGTHVHSYIPHVFMYTTKTHEWLWHLCCYFYGHNEIMQFRIPATFSPMYHGHTACQYIRHYQKYLRKTDLFGGIPLWLRCWRICLQCRKPRFDLWVRKIPWRKWQPTPRFLPGELHGQRSLVG